MADKRVHIVIAIGALLLLVPLFGVGQSFRPDTTVKGLSLADWHVLGQAEWKAQNGEIVGTVKAGGGGGWLVLNHSYQDVGFYASFRCTGDCKTGVLLRAEKTPEGMKGIYVSLSDGEVRCYRVTLDNDGKELQREALRPSGGATRIAPPLSPAAPSGGRGRGSAGRGAVGRGGNAVATLNLPVTFTRPAVDLRPGDWNRIEILLDANIVRPFLNGPVNAESAVSEPGDGVVLGNVADEAAGKYGPVALYFGGTGEVHFKDIRYKDLAIRETPPEQVSPNFRMQRINDFYYAWGAGAADFNHDGILDIAAGPYYYLGPDYTQRREIYLGVVSNAGTEFSYDCWMQFVGDFTGDGWADVITASFSADASNPERGAVGVWLYVNPKGESRRWDKYRVVSAFNGEIAVLRDLDGDGKPELVYVAEGTVRFAKPDPANPTGPWVVHSVSEPGYGSGHGIGAGDINGDGRVDIVNAYGWWEQPPAGSKQELWTYHPEAFARWRPHSPGGSVMAVYDVNGDGLNDVVTSLSAHGWGLAWYEQKRNAGGKISFVQHMIMDDFWTQNAGGVTFSEPHGSTFADVDGDGIPDFIVGKRYWSHKDSFADPDPYGPAVLYVYKTVRNPKAPGGAEFLPELVHNRSGAGSDVLAVDLNKDGLMDIVTATRTGTFIFWGKPRAAARIPAVAVRK